MTNLPGTRTALQAAFSDHTFEESESVYLFGDTILQAMGLVAETNPAHSRARCKS